MNDRTRTRPRLVWSNPNDRARARAAYRNRRAQALRRAAPAPREFTVNLNADDPVFDQLPVYRCHGCSVLDLGRACGLTYQLDGGYLEITGFRGLPERLSGALKLHSLLSARAIALILEEEGAAQ